MTHGKQELKIDQLALITAITEEINRQHGGILCADLALANGVAHIAKRTAALFDGIEVAVSRKESERGN